ncbi:MAG: recombination regulator RecX [Lachnospiraceae bacterium]|nr:recombination regulator RecX [Lachnospiraceae bacterium]
MQNNYIRSIISIQKAKKKICLSNGTDFVLYNKEVKQFNLQEGEDISEEEYETILQEVFYPRAKKRAMHLLEKMDRSEKQLRDKLRDAGYPPEAIDVAIDYVRSYHYLDDERLARSFVRFYQDSRSVNRIKQDLMKKGISKDIIAVVLEEEYTNSQLDLIRKLMEKKKYDPDNATQEEKAKMYRFLLGRGFLSSDISRAMHEEFE